ncbi:hypothetical protein [Hymenobacter jeollabukensis]|uniref:Uncharacterized protein n=1 Tax=Hymenobacter jeollabukensis TaxID=2025313 RepID=A0A5R8WTP7_9BACT|nr:hypothetical protein [Hymenobacter jeollabukensis]TLM95142.1 hypothetical protein FDY95_04935 [Hymenobacter jeollabukensis]
MPTLTVSEAASKPYVSRRKRHRRRQGVKDLLSTRSVLGLLGLLVLALLISLGIIATQIDSSQPEEGAAIAADAL